MKKMYKITYWSDTGSVESVRTMADSEDNARALFRVGFPFEDIILIESLLFPVDVMAEVTLEDCSERRQKEKQMNAVADIIAEYAEKCSGDPGYDKATCIRLIQAATFPLHYSSSEGVCCVCGEKTKWRVKILEWRFSVCINSYTRIKRESTVSL